MAGPTQEQRQYTPQSVEECVTQLKATAAEFNRLVRSAIGNNLLVRMSTYEEQVIGIGRVPSVFLEVMRLL